jgi:hypothetical protein
MIPVGPQSTLVVAQKKVMVCLPWLKQTNPITSFCVGQLLDKRRTAAAINFGDAFVAHSRNALADAFLASSLEWQLSIDDDMVLPFNNALWYRAHTGWKEYPEPFASFHTIDRLLSHGKTLVGALYFGRTSPGSRPVFNEGAANKDVELDARNTPRDELRPTKWVGTGCLLVHRSVYEDIEKRFPSLARGPARTGGQWYTSSEHTAMDWITKTSKMLSEGPMTGEKAAKAHEMLVHAESHAKGKSSLGMGEDVQFCLRAAEAGHQPYVDYGLCAGHIGHYVFGPKHRG